MDKSAIGDRIKNYERLGTSFKLMPTLPICVRIDGKNFSRFTKGLERPYDVRLTKVMQYTTKALVKELNATVGYTQSDEITLIFMPPKKQAFNSMFFDGKLSKLNSVIASMTTYFFQQGLMKFLKEKLKQKAFFDCRSWNVPSIVEALNVLQWREFDATKNSISMAAHHYFSHKSLHGVNTGEQQEMLYSQEGINWNDYPVFFKRGTYFTKQVITKVFSSKELEQLPEQHEARKNPNLKFTRHEIKPLVIEPLSKISIYEKLKLLFNIDSKGIL